MSHMARTRLRLIYSLSTADGNVLARCMTARGGRHDERGPWEVLIRAYEVGDDRWVAVPDRAVLRRENRMGGRSCAGREWPVGRVNGAGGDGLEGASEAMLQARH